MLSINIPVYNIDATTPVKQLIQQIADQNVPVEIRVYDDGSDLYWKKINRELATLAHVIYKELPQNLGRAAIRNKMGEDSIYPYLLFIDADSSLISNKYLYSYIDNLHEKVVICGGTTYSAKKPADTQMLRWKYGTRREAVSAEQRNRHKGFIITSNNFLIDRDLLLKIPFRTNLGPYGHEDTLLGYDLFMAGITPFHIDNPVEHTGLESSHIFLEKTKNALENLHKIAVMMSESSKFNANNPLLCLYDKLTRWIPPALLRMVFSILSKPMELQLTSRRPSLHCFDLYRICYFATINKRDGTTEL